MIGRVGSFAFVLTLVLTADLLSTPPEVLAQEEHPFSNLRFLPEDSIFIEAVLSFAIIAERLRNISVGQREGHGTEGHEVDPTVGCVIEGLRSDQSPEL